MNLTMGAYAAKPGEVNFNESSFVFSSSKDFGVSLGFGSRGASPAMLRIVASFAIFTPCSAKTC